MVEGGVKKLKILGKNTILFADTLYFKYIHFPSEWLNVFTTWSLCRNDKPYATLGKVPNLWLYTFELLSIHSFIIS